MTSGKGKTAFTTKQLVIDAVLAALCIILGYAGAMLDFKVIKITFESAPVIVGALMFGALDGALIGFVGLTVTQLILYPLSPTTPLWILPYVVCGLAVGSWAKRFNYYNSKKQLIVIAIAAELIVTLLNTAAIIADSLLYHYYSVATVWVPLAPRLGIAVAKGVALGFILPPLLQAMAKVTGRRK